MLVRHGETDWNLAGRIQGSTDIPLNDTGRRQAREVAADLRSRLDGPVAIVASDLSRARETAEIIAAELGLDAPHLYPQLREHAYGEAEGMTVAEFAQRHSRERLHEVPGAETLTQLRGRAVSAIRRVALMTVEGGNDDISGVGQTKAAHDLCVNIPAGKRVHYLQPKVGHYGVFNGSRFRAQIVPRIVDFIARHGRAERRPARPRLVRTSSN